MINFIRKNRYLISRRILQLGLLLIFGGANWWGWKFMMGNYSSAYVFESFHLTDPHAVLQSMAAGFLISSDALIGALILVIFYGLLAGRSFCSWICPLNMISDLASWLRKTWRFPAKDTPINISRNTRYWVLGLGLILSALLGIAAFEVINPITMLHRGIIFGFGMGWTYFAAVFLFELMVMERGWCGYLCPLGAFYSGLGRYSLIRIKHNAGACTLCMLCKDVCHEKQVLKYIGKKAGYVGGECSNCGRCIEACEEMALKFSIKKVKIRRI